MKIALVHDWFISMRGAEQQFKYIAEIFPNADIFFLLYDENLVKESFFFRSNKIVGSFLNKFPFKQKIYPFLLPLMPLAAESLDLTKYDIVISSSSNASKGVITRPDALHVSYVYTPTRNIWDMFSYYHGEKSLSSILRSLIISPLIVYYRIWDVIAAQRPTKIIAISEHISKAIKKYYKRDSEIIYPGIKFPEIKPTKSKQDFYLHITSFEPNKDTELLIQTFRELDVPLKIIGHPNRSTKRILSNLPSNISYLGWVSEKEKWDLIATSKALIISGTEDFGMSAVESHYLGTPVIAYTEGGVAEIVEKRFLFSEKTVESLKKKLEELDKYNVNPDILHKSAEKFSIERFKNEFKKYVEDSYANRN